MLKNKTYTIINTIKLSSYVTLRAVERFYIRRRDTPFRYTITVVNQPRAVVENRECRAGKRGGCDSHKSTRASRMAVVHVCLYMSFTSVPHLWVTAKL